MPRAALNPELAEIVTRLTTAALRVFEGRLSRVVLFGSHLRGDAKPGSDLDVAILIRGPVEDAWGEEEHLARLVGAVRPRLDIHVFDEAEFLRQAAVPGTLPYPIAREGVAVYEQA